MPSQIMTLLAPWIAKVLVEFQKSDFQPAKKTEDFFS